MNGICLRYLSDPHTVKDIVQEGFIKVFTKIKQYSGDGSFEGWMKRIFINTAISYIRYHRKMSMLQYIEAIEEPVFIEGNVLIDKRHIDFQTVLSADLSEFELLKVLDKLPGKYRLVFNLSCVENLKHEEIAKMLGISTATSRSRLSRARHIIQKEVYKVCIIKLSRHYMEAPSIQNTPKSPKKALVIS